MDTQERPTNGQSAPSTFTNDYDFTAPTNTIPVLMDCGGRKLIITYEVKKPTLKQLWAREDSIVRQSEEVARGESTMLYSEEKANAALFNQVVSGAEVREHGSETIIKTLTHEDCLRLPNERKSTVIKKMYRASFEVVSGDASDDLDFLFEDATDEIKVKQIIGDPLSPDFSILYYLRRPTQAQRDNYNLKAAQVRSLRGTQGGKPKTRIVTSLKESENLFNQLFVKMEGATGEAAHIDVLFKAEVVATAIQSYEDSAENF